MAKIHSVSSFYTYIKLDIWKVGQVADWGYVEKIFSISNDEYTNNEYLNYICRQVYLPKIKIENYLSQIVFKQTLSSNLYLLGIYLQDVQNNNDDTQAKTYTIVLCARRFGVKNTEHIHILKASNYLSKADFISVVTDNKQKTRRKLFFT